MDALKTTLHYENCRLAIITWRFAATPGGQVKHCANRYLLFASLNNYTTALTSRRLRVNSRLEDLRLLWGTRSFRFVRIPLRNSFFLCLVSTLRLHVTTRHTRSGHGTQGVHADCPVMDVKWFHPERKWRKEPPERSSLSSVTQPWDLNFGFVIKGKIAGYRYPPEKGE